MKAKEKAKELFKKMYNISDEMNKYPMCFDTAKACALVCVNESIFNLKEPLIGDEICENNIKIEIYYLEEIKQELKNFKR